MITAKPFMVQQVKENKGYITLMSVIILGAIAVSIAVTLLLVGINAAQNNLSQKQTAEARALTSACAELGLEKIRSDSNFTGTVTDNTTWGSGKSCSYNITGTSPNKTIQATGTVGTVKSKVVVTIDAINPNINITSWQEADFP